MVSKRCLWAMLLTFTVSKMLGATGTDYNMVVLQNENLDDFNNPVLSTVPLLENGAPMSQAEEWPLKKNWISQAGLGNECSELLIWQTKKKAGRRSVYQYVFDGATTPTVTRSLEPPDAGFLGALPFHRGEDPRRVLFLFWPRNVPNKQRRYRLMEPDGDQKGLMNYPGMNRLLNNALDLEVYGYSWQLAEQLFARPIIAFVNESGELFVGGPEDHIAVGISLSPEILNMPISWQTQRQWICAMDEKHLILHSLMKIGEGKYQQVLSILDRGEGAWVNIKPEQAVQAVQMFQDWTALQHSERLPGKERNTLTGKYTICSRDGEKRFALGPLDDSTDVEVLGIFGRDLFVRSDDKVYRADIARETGITNIRLILDGSLPENAHVKVRYAHWVLPKPSEDKPKPKEAPEAADDQNAAPESDPAAAAPVDDAQ